MAYIESRGNHAGLWTFVQLAGVVLCFLFPLGTVLGVLLIAMGASLCTKRVCGNCGNRVQERDSRMCPVCREPLERRPSLLYRITHRNTPPNEEDA